MMISHLSIGVSDLGQAVEFYDAVLAVLGYRRLYTGSRSIGYGTPDGREPFALKQRSASDIGVDAGFHLAFVAPTPEAVRAFHAAALARGAQDDGAPGPRSRYGSSYYAAFVIDLDGHKLEVVYQ